jgi:hypothetical protein
MLRPRRWISGWIILIYKRMEWGCQFRILISASSSAGSINKMLCKAAVGLGF